MAIELPLFPLHMVLFPGTPLDLHVFEPRYVALVEECLARSTPFGVASIKHGVEALGPLPEPHRIGCSADITGAVRLPSGRLDISAVGGERFRIVTILRDGPYLVGVVEYEPLATGDSSENARAESKLRRSLGRYLSVLAAASETQADLSAARLPASPVALAYVAASLLRLPVPVKQSLLESPELTALLSDVAGIYSRELPVLETLIAQTSSMRSGSFSRN